MNFFLITVAAAVAAAFYFSRNTAGAGAISEGSKVALGIRNNNPGNIKFSAANNWRGQIGKDKFGHVIFDTPEHGIRAIGKNLDSYFSSGRNTASKIAASWAEKNKTEYAEFIASRTGRGVNDVLGEADKFNVVKAIIHFENGSNPFSNDFIVRSLAIK